jgi:hypothetical protein
LKYAKKSINIQTLNLNHPFLELPQNVARDFERALTEKKLKELALIPAWTSELNGKLYYKFNNTPPSGTFEKVKGYFEDFGQDDELKGFLTHNPSQVADVLKIQII